MAIYFKKLLALYYLRFSKIKEKLKELYHLKYSIMFVPHSDKKVYSITVNVFLLLFFLVILLTLVIIATTSSITNRNIEKQRGQLYSISHNTLYKIATLESISRDMNTHIKDIENNIKTINYELFQKEGNNIKYSKHIFSTIDNNIVALKFTLKRLTTINNYLGQIAYVINALPSLWPIKNGSFVYPFWPEHNHYGIDIGAAHGVPIMAAADGVIDYADWMEGYGYTVMIKHKWGFSTLYGHCSRLNVEVGDEVKRGDIIAFVGSTGLSKGEHTHFEVWLGDKRVDPYPYLQRAYSFFNKGTLPQYKTK